MATYQPVVLSSRMSDFGFWVVDVSVSPDRTVSVMIAETGISPGQAELLALSRLPDTDRSIPL